MVDNQSTTGLPFCCGYLTDTQMVDAKPFVLLVKELLNKLPNINSSSLVERDVVELDIVAPDAPEAGQDLGEGRDDEVLAVPATNRSKELQLHNHQRQVIQRI